MVVMRQYGWAERREEGKGERNDKGDDDKKPILGYSGVDRVGYICVQISSFYVCTWRQKRVNERTNERTNE